MMSEERRAKIKKNALSLQLASLLASRFSLYEINTAEKNLKLLGKQ
jgi:hypothetical protein